MKLSEVHTSIYANQWFTAHSGFLQFGPCSEKTAKAIVAAAEGPEWEAVEYTPVGAAAGQPSGPRCPVCGKAHGGRTLCGLVEMAAAQPAPLQQEFTIGAVASELCRVLNVQDKQGWHWSTFIEILTRYFSQPTPPKSPLMMIGKSGEIHEYCPDCRGECSQYKPAGQPTPDVEQVAHEVAEVALKDWRNPNESIHGYQAKLETKLAAILAPHLSDKKVQEKEKLTKALKWVKNLYEWLSEEYKNKPSAFMSALSEDGELKELLK